MLLSSFNPCCKPRSIPGRRWHEIHSVFAISGSPRDMVPKRPTAANPTTATEIGRAPLDLFGEHNLDACVALFFFAQKSEFVKWFAGFGWKLNCLPTDCRSNIRYQVEACSTEPPIAIAIAYKSLHFSARSLRSSETNCKIINAQSLVLLHLEQPNSDLLSRQNFQPQNDEMHLSLRWTFPETSRLIQPTIRCA